MLKKCTKCNEEKELDCFYKKISGRSTADCIICHKDAVYFSKNRTRVEYRQSFEGKKSINQASRKSYRKNREKWRARYKARYAIQKGIIIKPDSCQDCGIKCSGHALQAHHKDYSKPLDVIFLCYKCHTKADELLNHNLLK